MKYTNNLKAIRIEKGLTQRQVATLMNMQCESRLSMWENGTSMPSIENLFHLGKIYNVLPHEIYTEL